MSVIYSKSISLFLCFKFSIL